MCVCVHECVCVCMCVRVSRPQKLTTPGEPLSLKQLLHDPVSTRSSHTSTRLYHTVISSAGIWQKPALVGLLSVSSGSDKQTVRVLARLLPFLSRLCEQGKPRPFALYFEISGFHLQRTHLHKRGK